MMIGLTEIIITLFDCTQSMLVPLREIPYAEKLEEFPRNLRYTVCSEFFVADRLSNNVKLCIPVIQWKMTMIVAV